MVKYLVCVVGVLLITPMQTLGQSPTGLPWKEGPAAINSNQQHDKPSYFQGSIGNCTISAISSADICSEVSGVIKDVWFDEGDSIKQGQVVMRLVTDRYRDSVRKAEARLSGAEAEVKRAREELRIQKELFAHKAATRQDVAKATTDSEVAESKLKESLEELELAKKDLQACIIKAPFSGFMAKKHKKANEAVDRLAPLFSLSDTSRVYAIANVEEQLAPGFEVGASAVFIHRSGKPYKGQIERVGSIIDPQSRTKKVYAVIENSDGDLNEGMSGTLRVEDR